MTHEYCRFLARRLFHFAKNSGGVDGIILLVPYPYDKIVSSLPCIKRSEKLPRFFGSKKDPRSSLYHALVDTIGALPEGKGTEVRTYSAFDTTYGLPESKGGQYATYFDIRNMLHLGIIWGLQRVLGFKPRRIMYDHISLDYIYHTSIRYANPYLIDYGSFYGLNVLCIGSIFRNEQGQRFIASVDPNPKWKKVTANPVFRTELKQDVFAHATTTLPNQPSTVTVRMGPYSSTELTGCGSIFLYSLGWSNWRKSEICPFNDFSVKLSIYDDIMTNPEHQDSYIEVLRQQWIELKLTNGIPIVNGEQELPWWYDKYGVRCSDFCFRNPHKFIPLSKKFSYYLYFEYNQSYSLTPPSAILEKPYIQAIKIGRGVSPLVIYNR